MKLNKIKVISNFISSLLGLFLPITLYICSGYVKMFSFSNYHFTPAKWILMGSLLFIAFNFLINKSLRLIGFLLALIALITLEVSIPLHNIITGMFFITCVVHIYKDKKLKVLSYPILISLPSALIVDIYYFELIFVVCLSIYMVLFNLRLMKLFKRNSC